MDLNGNIVNALMEEGLPRTAPPFLSFSNYSASEIADLHGNGVIPEKFVPLGQNGPGDVLGIDAATNEVLYFNHDASNLRVFINSTLALFLESLCIYQEHLHGGTMPSCLGAIAKIDPPAARPPSMWCAETRAS
ncbi:SUKH-4 family immunity protein [Burkholderia pyrrocinia]|uniref:SUKH-4 family immunity protein n=1 Tax=Burkholderia pyrrocinia TaxID=60550 RepID=UPI002AB1C57E|nr:SUKH-4 family immunity protein [Burkholderia pyrrocinia]